jgi:hypothetical protein
MHNNTVSGLEGKNFLAGFVRDIAERINLAHKTV